jgi:hypothetical protein
MNASNATFLDTLFNVLRNDTSMQELIPFLSRFFYHQIKSNSKRLSLLKVIVQAISALHQNSSVNFESQLQQLLPAIFTSVVGTKISMVYLEVVRPCFYLLVYIMFVMFQDHWSVRDCAAKLISELSQRYG